MKVLHTHEMVSPTDGPLWRCPRCGLLLLTRNLAHSCGLATVADWPVWGRALYRRFEAKTCGPCHVAPSKTRIAFLGRALRSPRFTRVTEVVPGWWVHRLRITDVAQLDAQVQRWLRRSCRLMGMQGRLRAKQPARAAGDGRWRTARGRDR